MARPDHTDVERMLRSGLITLNEARPMVMEHHDGLTLYADGERYDVLPDDITYGDYVDGLADPWYDPREGRHRYTYHRDREPKESSLRKPTAPEAYGTTRRK